MASSSHLLSFSALLVLASLASAQRPRALVVPVTKDATTLQYVARVAQRTPLVPLRLSVDLGGRFLWVDCDRGYVSSTYRPARCRSALCSLADADADGCGDCLSPPRPGCNNDTCGVFPENPFTRTSTGGELATDVLALASTDGANPGFLARDPRFLFSCAPSFLGRGLARGAAGVSGLGRNKAAPPSQLAAAFSFKRKFALCLSASASYPGVIFFGDGPYRLLPNLDAAQVLMYTPLLTNPVSTAGTSKSGEPSYEYFIGVTAIRVSEAAVPLNKTLLSIDANGFGGTKISTAAPYTQLKTSIYRAVTGAFAAALASVTRAKAVAPFGLCFEAGGIGSTRVGPAVPAIDFVLGSDDKYWRVFGANSMVEAAAGVLCLGFVDGGAAARTAVVIGGYQLEDNLVQFDLAASRLGFTSSLLFRQTTCANFNFTSTA